MSNHLFNETSPYLLQHAHNPVDWYPWGDEAVSKAKRENKPILVSIGYAACHWCHVMERESFEDEATAILMNEHFVNIKIDREERPDLDHIYMDAVQAMTGSGGWPLNVFLTPDCKPFYGGTYFPPQRAFNRPSWKEILVSVSQAFRERRHEIDSQAENLTDHIRQSNSFGVQEETTNGFFSPATTEEVSSNILKQADREWGGFGRAPKFPQTFTIQYLLRSGNKDHAVFSLGKMLAGGIYDQLGGGFARYSTDTEWLVPHFEKMLYDNALLVGVLSEAYQVTGEKKYAEGIRETVEFIERELMHPEKGFYSALDADSEGEEGRFYVWKKKEVDEVLGNNSERFCKFYEVTNHGNWSEGSHSEEGKNILRIIGEGDKEQFKEDRAKLLTAREKRVRPALDDKIILGWNALMNTACSRAFAATGEEKFRDLAISNMNFLLARFYNEEENRFHHTWKNQAKYPAFLEDLSFLIQALLHLHEITADTAWLEKAKDVTEMVIRDFSDEDGVFFYYTSSRQQDLIVRKKEIYDGAVPSGNSVMAENLHRLSKFFDKKEWGDRAVGLVSALGRVITRYPTSFANWACVLLEMITGTYEIAITGPGYEKLLTSLLKYHLPHKVVMASASPDPSYPLMSGKKATDPPSVWLCRDYSCQRPVHSISELITLINRGG